MTTVLIVDRNQDRGNMLSLAITDLHTSAVDAHDTASSTFALNYVNFDVIVMALGPEDPLFETVIDLAHGLETKPTILGFQGEQTHIISEHPTWRPLDSVSMLRCCRKVWISLTSPNSVPDAA